MAISVYLGDFINNRTLKAGTAVPGVATIYLALYTSNPTSADVGTEVTGGSYARQAITFGSSASGVASNSFNVPIA